VTDVGIEICVKVGGCSMDGFCDEKMELE